MDGIETGAEAGADGSGSESGGATGTSGRPRLAGWLAYLVGVLTPVTPVMLGIAYDQLAAPSTEVVEAVRLLDQLAPKVEAYRSQSDLLHVRAKRVATVMLRGGRPADVDDRYDDFLLIWSDYQTTWSDLLFLIDQEGGASRPELAALRPRIEAAANVASNRIDRCLLAANATYDDDAQEVMAARARTDSATLGTGRAEQADRRPPMTCPTGNARYFLMDDQLARLGGCNYAIRRVLVTTVADLRRTRDAGPLAKLGRRLGEALQGPRRGSIQPDYRAPLMSVVEQECSTAALTPRPLGLAAGQTLYPWEGAAPESAPTPAPAAVPGAEAPPPVAAAPPEKQASPLFF